MKGIKEFKPLLKLVKEEKTKLIIASIIIFASGLCEIFTGYLNGAAVEAITKLDIRTSLMYLYTLHLKLQWMEQYCFMVTCYFLKLKVH